MAIINPTTASTAASADPLATALGLVSWNQNWSAFNNALPPTSQTIYATAIFLPFGVPVNKVSAGIAIGAVGTAITGGYLGLCSPTAMVAQTATLGTAASAYNIGALAGTLTAAYTPTAADSALGLYYVLLLLNGTFGSTQPQFLCGVTSLLISANPVGGTRRLSGNIGTGQATLPANGTAITVSSGPGVSFAVAAGP